MTKFEMAEGTSASSEEVQEQQKLEQARERAGQPLDMAEAKNSTPATQQEDTGVSPTPVTVLVDMDGVLCNFDLAVKEKFQSLHPDHPELDLSLHRKWFYMSENYRALLGHDAAAAAREITEQENFFRDLPPIPGAVEAMKAIDNIPGVNVILCTAPLTYYRYVLHEKFSWVERHLGKAWLKKIVISKDKTVVSGRILIDDRPEVKGSIQEPSWEHVLFSQPYNNYIQEKRRLHSWRECDWRPLIESLLEQSRES